jgi:hypothetical protein
VNAASLRPRPLGAADIEVVRADFAAIGLLARLSPADVADLRRIGQPDAPPAVP